MDKRGGRWLAILALCFLAPIMACVGFPRLLTARTPTPTPLGPYDLTPAGQRVLMFEFSAARDRALIVAAVATEDDPDRRKRAELYLWEAATRRLRSLGRFDGVAAPDLHWVASGTLVRASDGGFFLFADELLRIADDGRVTPYPYGNRYGKPQLTADERLALRRAYEAHPEWTVAQIGSAYRLYEFDGRRTVLQVEAGSIVPDNPTVNLWVPPNPDFAPGSAITNAWSGVPYTSPSERLRVTAKVYGCVPLLWCLKSPTIVARIDARQYAFDYPNPFAPLSGYLTATDGTLFWLRDGHLYVLR